MADETKRATQAKHFVLTLTGSRDTRRRLLEGKGNVVDFFRSRGADPVSVMPDFGGYRNPLMEAHLRAEGTVVQGVVESLTRRAGRYGVPFRVVVEEKPDSAASSH
jgi:hypothetical protein